MKEEWLLRGAVVPVDVETTATLVAEIKRLIDVVGGLILNQGPHYERGFIDGMQKQMQSSVDKAVNAMTQPTYYIPSKDQHTWVGLMRGVRVEGDTLVITVKGGNDVARELCGALIEEMNK